MAPRLRVLPPVLAAGLVLAAWGAGRLAPTAPWIRFPWSLLGLAPAALGAGLAGWAIARFSRRGTTHHPFGEPTALVVEGPFRFTRNPMYLGLTLVLLGIGLLAGTAPFLLAPAAFALWIHLLQIPGEEAVLARLFGDPYEVYRRRVRRWL